MPKICPFCLGKNPECLKCFGETLLTFEEAQEIAQKYEGNVSELDGLYGVLCGFVDVYADGFAIPSITIVCSHEELAQLEEELKKGELYTYEDYMAIYPNLVRKGIENLYNQEGRYVYF